MSDTHAKQEGLAVPSYGQSLLLFLDFETFYSQSYSITKMDPASYILDPLFEAICLGVANSRDDPILIDGPQIPHFLGRLKAIQPQRPIVAVSHNAQFDMSILSWRYDFHPDLIIDTIAISRTILGALLQGHSLETVATYFGLPAKGSLIKQVKGMTRADIIANGLWEQESEYCRHDTWLCREIFKRLIELMPPDEIELHDMITRCTTEPLLRVDLPLLQAHLQDVMVRKAGSLNAIEQMGIGKSHLMSNQKFADVLRMLGVEPPMKVSPTTHEFTYAFSKQDENFTDLLEHENVLVRTVVEARLEHKSTLEETRAKRFINIGSLNFPNLGSCVMPMPVIIGAAHTHRVGGGWDLNVQNMGRGSTLRDAIHAQDGHLLLVADSKQIEARDTAWFCDETELVDAFRQGRDVYKEFAVEVFDVIYELITKPQRFVGKTGILQLGYASGPLKFQNTVRVLSQFTDTPMELTFEEAQAVVSKYRGKYRRITGKWRELDWVLGQLYQLPEWGSGEPGLVMKCITFYRQMLVGPTGLPIRFPGLHYDPDDGSWYFRDGKRQRRTYGASVLETIAQHIARCVVMGAGVRLRQPMANLGARLVHSAHDELVYDVPEANIESAKIWAQLEFKRSPSWAPDLPLDVDIGVGRRYGDCK